MKSKKLLLGILIGISTLFIAAEYGRMEVNGLLKVDTIQHNKNASGVYIEDVQFLNNVIRANAFYAGNTEITPGGSGVPTDFSTLAEKTTFVAGDTSVVNDAEDEGALKRFTLANLYTYLQSAFNSVYVGLAGDQTVAGVKTFSSSPIVPTPTTASQAAPKSYADGTTKSICQGRLTLTTGVPETTSDVTAATTLYFTPLNGDLIGLYNGSSWGTLTFTEASLSLGGLTVNTIYDIYGYDYEGSLTLESVAWTNNTTRATALTTQNGIYVKTGDTTKRYLGTIRITDVEGQCEDSVSKRFVWNLYNQVERSGRTYNSNASWSYTTAAWREYNNGVGQVQFEFITGITNNNFRIAATQVATGMTSTVYLGLALDGATQTTYQFQSGGAIVVFFNSPYHSTYLTPRYHTLTEMEYGSTGNTTHGIDFGGASTIKIKM